MKRENVELASMPTGLMGLIVRGGRVPNRRCVTFLEKLPDDEPAFTVRARDPIVLDVITKWLERAEELGVSQEKIAHVKSIRDKEIIPWQKSHKTKIPD